MNNPAGQTVWRIRSSSISSLISTTLVLYALGGLLLLLINVQRLSDYVKEHLSVSVVLGEDVPYVDAEFLRKSLDASPFVKHSQFISKEQAAEELTQSLGQDFLTLLQYNPLSPSIELRFHAAWANRDSIQSIAREILAAQHVTDVRWEPNLVDAVNENVRRISLLVLSFCLVMSFIAVVLIHNTIRLSVYSRRLTIKTMQLVGATAAFVRAPFVWRALGQGLLAALLAFALLLQTVWLLQRHFYELVSLDQHQMLALVCLFAISAGALLNGMTTYFAVNKYLASSMDELYH